MKLETKIGTAIGITLLFFLMELVVGIMTQSLALISDSFHMLHDVASQIVAYKAIVLNKKEKVAGGHETFGWQRAQVLGALINGACLTTISFTLAVQAVERFLKPEIVKDGMLVLIVACIGFLVNLLMLLVFHHHHHHEGHDHHHHHNLKGMMLHIMGDLLGSLAVILSGILLMVIPPSKGAWLVYVDPTVSIIISIFLAISSYPIIKESADILMQHAPKQVQMALLLEELEKVAEIDEVHVWNLTDQKIVASAHAGLHRSSDIHQLKEVFHRHGIHASTVETSLISERKPLLCEIDCDAYDRQCCTAVTH